MGEREIARGMADLVMKGDFKPQLSSKTQRSAD